MIDVHEAQPVRAIDVKKTLEHEGSVAQAFRPANGRGQP